MGARSFPWLPALIALGLVGLAVHYLLPVLVPFALACAAAYVLNPLVSAAEVRGLRRDAVVICGYLLGAALVVLLAGTLLPLLGRELASLREDVPAYAARARLGWLDFQRQLIERAPFLAPQIRKLNPAAAVGPILDQAVTMPSYALSAVPLLMLVFLVPFISFFLLLDGPGAIDAFIQRCPSRYVEQALHLVSEIDRSLGAYLRGLILVAVALTAASFVGLTLLGVSQAFWIALLSGFTSFVPYLGAVVGMVAGGLAAGFQFGTLAAALKVVALFLLIRLGDEIVLEPYIARRSVHLHPLVFLFTFMAGGELFGFIGLVFAVPVACVIKALVDVAWSWYASEARLELPADADAAGVPFT